MAITVFKMSQISMTMLEGVVVKWLKNEGDKVEKDEPLVEVQTDKVVSEMTSPCEGFVRKILAQEYDAVPVGGDLCIIADTANEDISAYINDKADDKQSVIENRVTSTQAYDITEKKRISPLAKKIALAENVDYKNITGTGPNDTIVKADIEKAISKRTSIKAETDVVLQNIESDMEIEIIPFRGIRKVTADHMMLSKQQTASVTTIAEVDMTKVGEYRKFVPVSYTTYVVKAAAEALKQFEIINSSIVGDEIHVKKQININVAVSTDKSLVTPVIRNAGNKNILSISDDIDVLAKKARDNRLTQEDFADGTFTVTNSGVFGSLIFTPIINYPQCAILGIGKLLKTPVVRNDEIVIATMMNLCLSYDHRIIDGVPAVQFLQRVKYYLENPEELVRRTTKEN